ncbi:hypothetical protein M405DRAFT_878058 [Rhizopogon salebrosus TDB-379]|nr:hypothetical protein M405DRAFT_878058 [Rhizopogon salebrosus TDB-379]
MKHPSALSSYKIALKFLADWQHVTGLSSSSNHFDVVSKATSSLAMDAFSCGVRYGALEAAVVLVEQGRSVFWTQLAHLQTPLDEISASGDMGNALAVEFKEASLHLRAMLEVSSEDKTSQIRQLTMQRDDVISRIRMLPDFSRFLLPPLFSDLRYAAEDGPVIIVNSSRYSCDAMIILSVADPVHVPLHVVQADILELSKKFRSLTEDAGSSHNQLYEIVGFLRTLWERVVDPIAEALKHLAQPGSRIWFEQRGVLSDLDEVIDMDRAALALRPPGHSSRSQSIQTLASSLLTRFKEHAQPSDLNEAFNLYGQLAQVSNPVLHGDLHAAKSWTTSAEQLKHPSALAAYQIALKFLADWQHVTGLSSSSNHFDVRIARDASTNPHFVAIGQGNPDKGKVLRRVAAEVDDVARCVTPILPFTSLMESDATVQRALDALNQHQWVHLACHGMPNRKKPFESSFTMRDGPLTITDIIRPRLHTPQFAFLSACHTTVGHESSLDESIHLTAAIQFSGFPSVIGSMWSVDDEVIGKIVCAFYDNMVDGSGKLDCRRAAVALHNAVKKLRKKIPLEQQIVLVHMGV